MGEERKIKVIEWWGIHPYFIAALVTATVITIFFMLTFLLGADITAVSTFLLGGFVIASVTAAIPYIVLTREKPSSKERKKALKHLLREVKDFPCPLCNGETEISRVSVKKSVLIILRCTACMRESMWEHLEGEWQLIAPLTRYEAAQKPLWRGI